MFLLAGVNRVVRGDPKHLESVRNAQRLDATRISDLSEISKRTRAFWKRRGRLPVSLAELAAEQGSNLNVRDPATASPYRYRVKNPNVYELCADFDRSTTNPQFASGHFWSHRSGTQCADTMVKPVQ